MNKDSKSKDEASQNEKKIEELEQEKEHKNIDHLYCLKNYINEQENQEEKVSEKGFETANKVEINKNNHCNNRTITDENNLGFIGFINSIDNENLISIIYNTEKAIKDLPETQKSEIKQEEAKMIISKNLIDITENDIITKKINLKEKDSNIAPFEQKEKDEFNEKSENEPKTEEIINNIGINFSNEFNSFSNIDENEQKLDDSRDMSLDDSDFINNNIEAQAPTENNLINYNEEKEICFGDNSKKFLNKKKKRSKTSYKKQNIRKGKKFD